MMLNNIWYYLFCGSAVFIYGIGINRSILVSREPAHLLLDAVKLFLSVTATSLLTYLIVVNLLSPAKIVEIYPFMAVLIFSVISVFIEAIVRITAHTSLAEYTVSVLCILLAVNESSSLTECLLNSVLCVLSYYLSIPVLFSMRKRIELSNASDDFQNMSLLFFSIAILLVILLAWNVSWLNLGGAR